MLFLHAGSLERVKAHSHRNLGRLVQPRDCARLRDTLEAGVKVGVDNDAFTRKRDLFLLMSVLFVGGCGFVAVTGVASRCLGRAENLGKSGEVWSPDPCVVI